MGKSNKKKKSQPKRKKSAAALINLKGVSDPELDKEVRGISDLNVLLYTQDALRTLRSRLLWWLQQALDVKKAAVEKDEAVQKKRTSKANKEASTEIKDTALEKYNSEVAIIDKIEALLTGAIVGDKEDARHGRLNGTPTGDDAGNCNPPPSMHNTNEEVKNLIRSI